MTTYRISLDEGINARAIISFRVSFAGRIQATRSMSLVDRLIHRPVKGRIAIVVPSRSPPRKCRLAQIRGAATGTRSLYLRRPPRSDESTVMLIRYGFNIEIDVGQETTILTARICKGKVARRHCEEAVHHCYVSLFHRTGSIRMVSVILAGASMACPALFRCRLRVSSTMTVLPDPIVQDAGANAGVLAPWIRLPFLLASRYCETELLNSTAWCHFGGIKGGWARVQAICDFVHDRLVFSYPNARSTRTALEAFNERTGVCRDFTHLAVTLCRCMNIPARYCNGYLGDIGVPSDPSPMDFNAWFDAMSADVGTLSTRGTMFHGSAVSLLREAGTRWTSRCCIRSGRMRYGHSR